MITLRRLTVGAYAVVLLANVMTGGVLAQSAWRPEPGAPSALGIQPRQGEPSMGPPILRCDGGKWKIDFGLLLGLDIEKPTPARLVIDGKGFPTTGQKVPDGNWFAIPATALAALRTGERMSLEIPGRTLKPTVFSLRGASQAMDHVEKLCIASNGPPAVTQTLSSLPLKIGTYAEVGTPCESATGEKLTQLAQNGRAVGRYHTFFRSITKSGATTYKVTEELIANMGDRSEGTFDSTYEIPNDSSFKLSRPSHNSAWRLCARSSLPGPMRNAPVLQKIQ